MKKLAFAVTLASLAAAPVMAHTGHDPVLGNGVAHWLLSPLHGVGVMALAGALFGLRTLRRKE
jgi:hypothetical protein